MPVDDAFEPRLGKMRAIGKRGPRSFKSQVLRAAHLAGGIKGEGTRSARFRGSRLGKGAGAARVLSGRDRLSAYRQRRVVIKARLTRLDRASGHAQARAHLRYLQRDGVTRDGQPGALYSADTDRADGQAFLDRQDGDRHHFRFIVSPEDGDQYDDLRALTRRLMAQAEQDLGTRLDWVAVDHFNTGHPHTHILVRGRDDQGRDLVIAREYISHGLRERAAELVSLDLGPRTDIDIVERLRRDIDQERLTTIDRTLIKDMDVSRVVTAADADPMFQSLRAGRLQTLGRFGLARELAPGTWQLSGDAETTLKRMGERGDIIRILQRAYASQSAGHALDDYAIVSPASGRPLTGRLVERGLADELSDRHYLILDGTDGRSHYADIGQGAMTEPIPVGAIVRLTPKSVAPKPIDRTIAEIAAVHDGRYSIDIHLRHDPHAREAFAETHVRRLEAMRRAGFADRDPDGTWRVAADHLDKAAAFEAQAARSSPLRIDVLSRASLEQQLASDGATWLDRELVAATPEPLRDAGFGREARAALRLRQQWLIEQDLARESDGLVTFTPGLLASLQQRELARIGGQLSVDIGKPYAETRPGKPVDGVYRRHVDLTSGPFALIEKSRDFTLVPWRPVLERHIGQSVSGIVRDDGINWTIGRSRSGPSIS